MVEPFWYRLTQAVLEKKPLDGCLSVVLALFFDAWTSPHYRRRVRSRAADEVPSRAAVYCPGSPVQLGTAGLAQTRLPRCGQVEREK